MLKTETGSLLEGKVKIKLEHDGTILDVDEDDIEKVSEEKSMSASSLDSIPPLNRIVGAPSILQF